MGRIVCRAVADDPDLTLVAAVDRSHVGEPIGPLIGLPKLEIPVTDELHELLTAEAEVAVDFTHARRRAGRRALGGRARRRTWSSGTTGIGRAELEEIRTLLEADAADST